MKFYPSSVSFASGELSPVLSGRVDLAAYSTGAKELTNFLVLPQGGLINRPGTISTNESSSLYQARLIPFIFNSDISYCLVYKTDGYILIYSHDRKFIGTFGAYKYTPQELREIKWLQSADIIYIFHKNIQVQKISRHSESSWGFEMVEFKNGPFQDMNTDRTGNVYTGDLSKLRMRIGLDGTITYIESEWPFFTPNHVGLLFKLEFMVPATSGRWSVPGYGGESHTFMLFGPSTITSSGRWWGTMTVMRKRPNDTEFIEVASVSSQDDVSLGYQEDVEEYGTMFKVIFVTPQMYNRGGAWTSGGGIIARQVKITAYNGNRIMIATPLDEINKDTGFTRDWALGAFGGTLGYPSIGIFHQERLVLANNKSLRQTIWMSRSASWEDFGTEIPTEDTDSISITLASKEIDDIVGLSSRDNLLILTVGTEWSARAGKQNDIFTPSSVLITPSSYHGSHNVSPLEVGTSLMFAQRHGKAIRGMGYSIDVDGYVSNDISVLSEHIFEGTRVKEWDYQQDPWSIVWIVLESGDVATLTVQEEHKVMAWTRCKFNTPIRDVCCVPGREQDEVFFLTWGSNPDTAKLLQLNHRSDKEGSFDDSTYLDEGKYGYISSFEGMELEENANGSLQGRLKQIPRIMIRVFRSCGFHAGIMTENNNNLDQIKFDGQTSPSYLDIPFTGDVNLPVPGGNGRQARVRIENRKPVPLTILGIYRTVHLDGEK